MTPPQYPIPMLDLKAEVHDLWPELSNAVDRVLRSGQYVLGSEVEAFESEVAQYLGVRNAVGLNSGTDALAIGLRALGVAPGDEVITTSFSFWATVEAVKSVGAIPVFVDICGDSFNLNTDRLEAAITERTKVILPVHLFGNPAAMSEIRRIARHFRLKILEDCAQSFGAAYYEGAEPERASGDKNLLGSLTGSLGDAGAFSFYPTKNLGAYGDAGMLVTDDDEVAHVARLLRNHGAAQDRRYENQLVGYNSRLDEFQAAILRVKLPHVDGWNQKRRAIAQLYRQELKRVSDVIPPKDTPGHVYHQFTIRLPAEHRNKTQAFLSERGVATKVFYPTPLHRLMPGVYSNGHSVSESTVDEVLSLPIWPGLSPDAQEAVIEAILQSLK